MAMGVADGKRVHDQAARDAQSVRRSLRYLSDLFNDAGEHLRSLLPSRVPDDHHIAIQLRVRYIAEAQRVRHALRARAADRDRVRRRRR